MHTQLPGWQPCRVQIFRPAGVTAAETLLLLPLLLLLLVLPCCWCSLRHGHGHKPAIQVAGLCCSAEARGDQARAAAVDTARCQQRTLATHSRQCHLWCLRCANNVGWLVKHLIKPCGLGTATAPRLQKGLLGISQRAGCKPPHVFTS